MSFNSRVVFNYFMYMIEFTNRTPIIADVYRYTYSNPHTYNRFKYEKRDVLKTKIYLEKRIVYKKNKEGQFSAPTERLMVKSYSYPQYEPYLSVKSKNAKKQRIIRHEYDVIMCIQPYGEENEYSYWHSKIIWRVGSFKKWKNPPQSQIKSIYRDTRKKLENKYKKLPTSKKEEMIKHDISSYKKRAKYLDAGDWNSRVNGICGDDYFRSFPLQMKYDALYGRCYFLDCPKDISFCFFSKHALAVIHFLLKHGILKYK